MLRGYPNSQVSLTEKQMDVDRGGSIIRWVLSPDQVYVRPRAIYLFTQGTGTGIRRKAWSFSGRHPIDFHYLAGQRGELAFIGGLYRTDIVSG